MCIRDSFKIALPAALVTLVIILMLSLGTDISGTVQNDYNLLELIPYLIVLVGGIVGINVFIVLLLGILSGSIIVVAEGAVAATDLLGNMGTGAAGMFETTMVAVDVYKRQHYTYTEEEQAKADAAVAESGDPAAAQGILPQVGDYMLKKAEEWGADLRLSLIHISTAHPQPTAKRMSQLS